MNYVDSSAIDKQDSGPPCVEVAVTLVRHGPLLLAGMNGNWEAFTLPMTKRRYAVRAEDPASFDPEPWADAAVRNVAEWCCESASAAPVQLMTVQGYRQSDRDLVVKEYHFEIFTTTANDDEQLRPDVVAEWLTPDEFRELHRRPISPTARYLIETLENAGKLDVRFVGP